MAANDTSEWLEDLPPKCPPSDATDANGERFLRAVSAIPPIDEDFQPKRAFKFPIKKFSLEECKSKAVSLFTELTALRNALKIGEHQKLDVVWINLPRGSGKILATGRPSHYSWWRLRGFNPLEHYTRVNE